MYVYVCIRTWFFSFVLPFTFTRRIESLVVDFRRDYLSMNLTRSLLKKWFFFPDEESEERTFLDSVFSLERVYGGS